ncbi:glycoside hydrolase family 18 protein, partial [Pseudohyphozyma bogoriensis]
MLLLLALLVSFASAKSSGLLALYWPAYTTVQPVASIPASDIAYYFVTVTDNSTGLAVPAGQPVAEISQFVDHAHARGTKALVSVGGWTGSRFFSSLVATAASRVTFASALESFVHEHGFDGVDFDWEYPASTGIGCNGNSPSDAANFLAFLQTVRDKLGKKALITAAVASGGIIGSDGQPLSDVSGFADVLDFINVMAYDVTGSWSESTGPNAPLHNCLSGTSAESAIQYWTSAGFPASNILLGVPSYGHSFTTTSSKLILKEVSGSKTLLYQEKTSVTPMGDDLDVASMAGTDECGVSIQANQYSGVWSYRNLIAGGVLSANGKEGKGGYVRYYDECTATPFLFSPSKRDLIAYEDLESLTAKVAFANTKGLAGIFVFDFTGFPNSILKSIKNGLAGESASTSSRAKPTSSHIEHSNASHAALTLPHVEPNTTATTTSIESTTTKAPALRLTLAPTTSKQTTPPPTPTSTTDESTCTGAY